MPRNKIDNLLINLNFIILILVISFSIVLYSEPVPTRAEAFDVLGKYVSIVPTKSYIMGDTYNVEIGFNLRDNLKVFVAGGSSNGLLFREAFAALKEVGTMNTGKLSITNANLGLRYNVGEVFGLNSYSIVELGYYRFDPNLTYSTLIGTFYDVKFDNSLGLCIGLGADLTIYDVPCMVDFKYLFLRPMALLTKWYIYNKESVSEEQISLDSIVLNFGVRLLKF